MTIDGLKKMWPTTWGSVLQGMYANGFVLCLKCGGLLQEAFIDSHNSACPGR